MNERHCNYLNVYHAAVQTNRTLFHPLTKTLALIL